MLERRFRRRRQRRGQYGRTIRHRRELRQPLLLENAAMPLPDRERREQRDGACREQHRPRRRAESPARYHRPPAPGGGRVIVKGIILLLLLAIVTSLFSGLFFLMHDASDKRRTLTALKIRVALSITLIVFLVV